jgi:glycosyltransferase involved in cell wall biosynthesis
LEKLTIVHVADYVMPGMGYQEFALAKWNARHGHEVHMVTSDRYTPVPHYEQAWEPFLGHRVIGPGLEQVEGVTIHRLPCRLELKRRPWLAGLSDELKGIRPDVVLCHGTASPSAFALPSICRRLGAALIMDNHETFGSARRGLSGLVYRTALRALSRRLLNRSVYRFLGVSPECCDFMVQRQGLPSEKVERLDLGVDTDIFRPDDLARQAARAEYGLPLDASVVVQTGKLTLEKSPHLLARAMAPIMRDDPKVWLVFVGAAPAEYAREIVEPLAKAAVDDRLLFIPLVPVSKLVEIFNLADICVYPGESSLSCLEAAACGKPVIVTDSPAGRSRAAAGLVQCYQTGNVSDLRQQLQQFLADRDTRENMGERALASVLNNFFYDLVASRAEAIMNDAIAAEHGVPVSK